MANVYVHIPFCERICNYCDFPKRIVNRSLMEKYLDALGKETRMYEIRQIDTLYFGGGTPSVVSPAKLSEIVMPLPFSRGYEWTVEANSEHITPDKAVLLKEIGVNRVSLGVQSFNEKQLKLLNRGHDAGVVNRAVQVLKTAGIENISIDLMYAIPFQTLEDVKADIEAFKKLDIPHVSAYSLILEERTVFNKWHEEGKLPLIDNELEAEMYELYLNELQKCGYRHYEISNFAYPGFESRHNQIYWQNKHYYGLGMGASGYLGNVRYYNENRLSKYLEMVQKGEKPVMHSDALSVSEQIKEEFMLGLRLIDGVKIQEVNKKYQIDVLNLFDKELTKLKHRNLITVNESVKLTQTGILLGNEVFAKFI